MDCEELTEKRLNCDHHLGDDGEAAVCSKCGFCRHMAMRVGRMKQRRVTHSHRMTGVHIPAPFKLES